jgi:5-methylcytosine-specific restriction endonuclease McrA
MNKKTKRIKAPKTRKSKVEKPFNSGTMSVSAFWSFIRSALRQKSRWWKPILECKKAARRPYKGPIKRQKWEYKCSVCGNYFPEKRCSVDHIHPLGQLKDYSDLPHFVKTLFCEVDNLQVLHDECHNKKTKLEKDARNSGS